MEKFVTERGTGVALRRSNVDTDQIIPAEYLKRVTRSGFEDGLFERWRSDPDFVLNRPEHAGAVFLVTGPDFGTGSSREHAVWALQGHGFRAVIGSRFGDIFRSNAGKNGLLVAEVDQREVEELQDLIDAAPATPLEVDLAARTITAGPLRLRFRVDDHTRWRLMEGLDDIGLTLRDEATIAAFEERRPAFLPHTLPVRTPAS